MRIRPGAAVPPGWATAKGIPIMIESQPMHRKHPRE